MKLSPEEVNHIAELARLDLSPSEKALYQEQLSNILDYFSRLQSVDTSSIPPTARVSQTELRLRADRGKPSLAVEALLREAAESDSDQFRIPPVLD